MRDIFEQGRNYWRRGQADYAAVIVDYGNYYRDLHESIVKARKSIFILGWDIDSRIELLRGHDAEESPYPTTFFDLICWKAKGNPDLQIYLNKWDYSFFFMRQREPFWEQKWSACALPNIHYCMDDHVPLGACHHQKIALIDDEIAYWGGMDVALGRWDFREHHVVNDARADPGQVPRGHALDTFMPYHDIQAVVAGPIVKDFSELVRERWRIACPRIEPVRFSPPADKGLPQTWPDSDPPDFENVEMVIARTLPVQKGQRQIEEIYRLLLDEIAVAENFIYIENQYLACDDIARALNRRLKERPNLRVLLVSCYNPQGFMECNTMYAGRVHFRDALDAGGVGERAFMSYPVCCENDEQVPVRIHSKLMSVDDRYLHIGSANFNNRSMGLDTEFDVVIIGHGEKSRAKIADIRNDLIREHTGHDLDDIQTVIAEAEPVHQLLQVRPESRQHLRLIDDERYRLGAWARKIMGVADLRRPLISAHMTRLPRHAKLNIPRGRTVAVAGGLVALVAVIAMLWSYTPLAEYTETERLATLMEQTRQSPFAVLWITALYVVGGLMFFPVTALSGAVILVFGGLKGFAYSLIGSLASGLVGYLLGRAIGRERMRRHFPRAGKIMDKVRNSGVIGVAVIRTLPIAPFSVMNMVMGVAHVTMPAFILGTILGLSPGKLMLAIFGETLTDVFKKPDPQNITFAVLGLAGWIAVGFLCHWLAKSWQARQEQAA